MTVWSMSQSRILIFSGLSFKTEISNLVCTPRFWNNFHIYARNIGKVKECKSRWDYAIQMAYAG